MNGELPKGWVWTSLESITDIVLGQSPPSSTYNKGEIGLPFYQGKSEFGLIYPTPTKWCSSPKKIAEKGDVLISVRAPVGPTNICPEKSCIGRGLAAIRGLGNINNKFILYLLRNSEEKLRNKATGTTFEAITGNVLRNFEVPLPPLTEQQRIVNKIEELFTNLDKGVESLEQVKYKLKVYRQAILKYAMEGKLTEKWREENKDKINDSDINIRNNLDIKNLELDKFSLINSNFFEISNKWVWRKIGDICILVNGRAFKPSDWSTLGLPIIRIQNLNNINSKYNYCNFKVEDKYYIDNDDLLFGWSGTPGTSFGAHIWKGGKAILNQHIFKVIINNKYIEKRFFYHLLNYNVKEYIKKAHGTAGLAHITKGKFENSIVQLPPLEEQNIIVERIEKLFSLADYIEETVDSKLEQSKPLRQSILKKAFEGKLVPQDPNDEPAEILLEKIKKQRLNKEKIVQEKLV